MKTKLLIIIGIIIAIGIVTTILTMNFSEDKKTTVSDITLEQLEAILEHCIDSKDLVETVGLSYYNNTHFIDTITCEWQKYDGVQIDSEGLDANWIGDEDYCQEWCDNDELYKIGCDESILAHLAKYSNLFDEEFDGTFNLDWISLPNDVSTEKFEWCIDFIYDKRLPSEEELDILLDRWENMCSGGVPQCFGTFDNGTEVRIQCPDYPWKCGITDFDNYTEVENEN